MSVCTLISSVVFLKQITKKNELPFVLGETRGTIA